MSELANAILELVERGEWAALTAEDHSAMRRWLLSAQPIDLYLLLLEAKRRWRRTRRSSSTTLQAIQEYEAPLSERPAKGDDDE